jgi:hypothetical protein
LARSTWKRYSAALQSWKCFAKETEGDWRHVSDSRRGKFIGWCRARGKLSAGSVKVYLGELKRLEEMRRQLRQGGGDFIEKELLKGYENLGKEKRGKKKRGAIPVNLEILDVVRKKLKKSGWAEGSRLCLWAACLIAFWGAVRLSEILPKGDRLFDKFSDLLWKNVKWDSEKGMKLEIRGGKVPGPPGNCVRLFAVKKTEILSRCCPKDFGRVPKNSQTLEKINASIPEGLGKKPDKIRFPKGGICSFKRKGPGDRRGKKFSERDPF